MNNDFFFSVIVPCWNCSETIERLLDSLVQQQGTAKEEFEVILCDDGHDDNWVEKINRYKNLLNIVYIQTKEHKYHCPGNTRRDALPYARGKWITFIDNDDMFVTDALSLAKKYILENNLQYVLCMEALELDINDHDKYKRCGQVLTLLHGKFYNRDFLNKYNINFKEDFITHEDLFFNTLVLTYLYKEKQDDFFWVNKVVYIWVMNYKSITRSYVFNPLDKNYLEAHFSDYLDALSINYINILQEDIDKETRDNIEYLLVCSIIYGYFYYQGELFYLKEKSKSELNILKKHIYNIMNTCNISKKDIIRICYKDPLVYGLIRKEIPFTSGPFIEDQSFKDFIMTNID